MTRLPDWQSRLTVYVDACRQVAPTHCGYFAGRAVEVMTGGQILPDTIIGQKRADLVAMGNLGHRGLESFIGSMLPERDGPAEPGDVVILDENVIGILQGRMVYVMSSAGLVMISTEAVKKVFRV